MSLSMVAVSGVEFQEIVALLLVSGCVEFQEVVALGGQDVGREGSDMLARK